MEKKQIKLNYLRYDMVRKVLTLCTVT